MSQFSSWDQIAISQVYTLNRCWPSLLDADVLRAIYLIYNNFIYKYNKYLLCDFLIISARKLMVTPDETLQSDCGFRFVSLFHYHFALYVIIFINGRP